MYRDRRQDVVQAAPIKCAGRESDGRPTDSSVESAGLPTESPIQSAGRMADYLPAHFIGATSEVAPGPRCQVITNPC